MICKEKYNKEFILICLSNLLKSSIDSRRPYNSQIENYVLVMNPPIRNLNARIESNKNIQVPAFTETSYMIRMFLLDSVPAFRFLTVGFIT